MNKKSLLLCLISMQLTYNAQASNFLSKIEELYNNNQSVINSVVITTAATYGATKYPNHLIKIATAGISLLGLEACKSLHR